ncbi:glycosylphosphatidylinositol anchor biosynthesis protein 11 isoform X2 [Arachis duranensis]|uniref:Glycosylphosphatidylinositol anchor biosynthesis protein 11 isoform X2 n=1 Tax=Arachis duranensis TaxID=130453 RepID=A0A6P5MTN3_ARADU|nr:glycosylphosphatidylinositol anchor biosynthesis protein 11 isoform X2 [Arachis duranensis]XP_025619887.1 glycosylphosphatidylinositol anchor biosynthesis protein 11 isoform X5 [Arachis hypogaea]
MGQAQEKSTFLNTTASNFDPLDPGVAVFSSMDRRKKREKTTVTKPSTVDAPLPPKISPSEAFIVTLSSVLGLGLAFYVANSGFSIDLVTDPSRTIFFIWLVELPIVILLYSRYRQNPRQCMYLRAVGRGLLAVPIGALLNCLGAIALGAPVTFQQFQHHVFLVHHGLIGSGSLHKHTHGAVIGGWFGAWPMPLDWERPWQEWPICVSYGAIGGYMVGLVASCVFVLAHARSQHVKQT